MFASISSTRYESAIKLIDCNLYKHKNKISQSNCYQSVFKMVFPKSVSVVFCCCLISASPCQRAAPLGLDHEPEPVLSRSLVWTDEFNSTELDISSWRASSVCLENYCYRRDNAKVANHLLTISAQIKESKNGTDKQYSAGRILSELFSELEWQYGRFEVSAKLSRGENFQPTISLTSFTSTSGNFVDYIRIDLLTAYNGQRFKSAVSIIGSGRPDRFEATMPLDDGVDLADEFHTYAVDWSPKRISFLLDGREYFSKSLEPNHRLNSGHRVNFDIDLDIWQRDWTGPTGADLVRGGYKPTLEVDYVRVYQ